MTQNAKWMIEFTILFSVAWPFQSWILWNAPYDPWQPAVAMRMRARGQTYARQPATAGAPNFSARSALLAKVFVRAIAAGRAGRLTNRSDAELMQ